MDSLDKWLKISELPGGVKDPFAEPYGPTENCFSSNDIVRMFRLGATRLDYEHFAKCGACEERIGKYAKVTEQPVPAKRWNWFGRALPSSATAQKALIYSPAICMVDPRGFVQSIAGEVLTNVNPELQGMMVTLKGPVTGSVMPGWDGKSFRLKNVKASPEVVEMLRDHRQYMQPVQLEFGKSASAPQLIAYCNLEFSSTNAEDMG